MQRDRALPGARRMRGQPDVARYRVFHNTVRRRPPRRHKIVTTSGDRNLARSAEDRPGPSRGWKPELNLPTRRVLSGTAPQRATEEAQMKVMLLPTAFAVLFAAGSAAAPPAAAKGCLKGAAVGGVAGHYAGHHAILVAVGGCIVGHHMAAKHAQEEKAQQQQPLTSPTGDNQGSPSSGH